MRTQLLAALAVLTSCVLLTGLSMPDAPRPQRHAKPQVQTFAEKQSAQGAQQAQEQQTRNSAQKTNKAPSHKQPDRSPRTTLPSKRLR